MAELGGIVNLLCDFEGLEVGFQCLFDLSGAHASCSQSVGHGDDLGLQVQLRGQTYRLQGPLLDEGVVPLGAPGGHHDSQGVEALACLP